jgi:hypothetical protein
MFDSYKKIHFIYILFSNHIHTDVYVCISVKLWNMKEGAPKTKYLAVKLQHTYTNPTSSLKNSFHLKAYFRNWNVWTVTNIRS